MQRAVALVAKELSVLSSMRTTTLASASISSSKNAPKTEASQPQLPRKDSFKRGNGRTVEEEESRVPSSQTKATRHSKASKVTYPPQSSPPRLPRPTLVARNHPVQSASTTSIEHVQSPTRLVNHAKISGISSRRKQQPQTTTAQPQKEKDFVTANKASTAITSTATGLSWRNKAAEAEAARTKLKENDKRLAEAMRRLEMERIRADTLLQREKEMKRKKLAAAKEKRLKETRRQKTDHQIFLNDLDGCSTGGYDGEGVSLDFAQDDLFVPSESPPRNATFYRNTPTPSPTRTPLSMSPTRAQVLSRTGQYSVLGLYETSPSPAAPPSFQNKINDATITILDIPPSPTHRLRGSPAQSAPQQLQADPADEDNDAEDAPIVICNAEAEYASPLDLFTERALVHAFTVRTQAVGMQTDLSRPTRIVLPRSALESVRRGRLRVARARGGVASGSGAGLEMFEPIEAIVEMANEMLQDLLDSVLLEISQFSDEFVQGVLAAEFMNHMQ
ncbi:hypothetical protein BC830DRAFT_1155175 [Chytriomyces sp. MP71]|nr:hypothetical protein BC830DRAFT_1155175 [Chytriomyces sp. MP71]